MSNTKMIGVACTSYGSPEVLKIKEFQKPVPKSEEILIRVKASAVTTADSMMRKGEPFYGRLFLGLFKPKNPITGTGFAGVIEAVGKDVKLFKKGDAVFGETAWNFGANAEYICLPETGLILTKPDNLTFEEMAPICDGALTSMSFLKDLADIQPGHKILIIGAAGSLGTAAVQLANHYGANVTAVCSTANFDMVKNLGANKAIDYRKEDFTQNGESYDIIYDAVGKSSYAKCQASLTEKGIYLSPVLSMKLLFRMIWTAMFDGKKAKFSATGARPIPELKPLLKEIKTLMKKGQLKSVIDQCFSMEQIVAAHQYIDTGHKKGNIVLLPDG